MVYQCYQIEIETHTNPTITPNTKIEGCPIADPELGLSPLIGPPPVEVADEILPTLGIDDAGGEVILISPDEVTLILLVRAVLEPGKGTMEGAEKFPNPLGSPVLLGTLPVSYVEKAVHIRWWPSSSNGTPARQASVVPGTERSDTSWLED